MASGMRFGRFRPDSAGIMEVFKGAGMQAVLSSAAGQKASAATSVAHLHRTSASPEYEGVSKVLDRTAVGIVRPANWAGYVDQKYHHTLDSLNH